MNIISIIFFLLVVMLVLFLISILKKLLKVAFVLGVIFLIVFIITSGSIAFDFNDIKGKLSDSSKLILLSDGSDLMTGFIDYKGKTFFTASEFGSLNDAYKKDELINMTGENYKRFIFDVSVFKELPLIEINNIPLSGEEIYNFYVNDNPLKITLSDITEGDDSIQNDNLKEALFAYLYDHELKITKSPLFFFKNYKDKAIEVHPETMFFKFVDAFPLGIISNTIDSITGYSVLAKDKIVDYVK